MSDHDVCQGCKRSIDGEKMGHLWHFDNGTCLHFHCLPKWLDNPINKGSVRWLPNYMLAKKWVNGNSIATALYQGWSAEFIRGLGFEVKDDQGPLGPAGPLTSSEDCVSLTVFTDKRGYKSVVEARTTSGCYVVEEQVGDRRLRFEAPTAEELFTLQAEWYAREAERK